MDSYRQRDEEPYDFQPGYDWDSAGRLSDDDIKPKLPRSKAVYVLGTGALGKFLAYAMRGIREPPPVTLIVHLYSFKREWEVSPKEITFTTGHIKETRTGFGMQVNQSDAGLDRFMYDEQASQHGQAFPRRSPSGENSYIEHLIVTVKAPFVKAALRSVRHRLDRRSTIVFLQNGMGIIEEVNKHLFPDVESRPRYMAGIVTHGLQSISRFAGTHTGFGTTWLGYMPHTPAEANTLPPTAGYVDLAPSTLYLYDLLTRIPLLAAVGFDQAELRMMQLEKLAIRAVIEPLTIMLDGRNGVLTYNYFITRTIRLLLAEISLVLRSLPELKGLPNVESRFAPERLETLVVRVASQTANTISVMLGDVRKGSQTEIDYVNGYIVKRGEELGIKCVMNYMMVQLVKGKHAMTSREVGDAIPFEEELKWQ